MKEMNKILTWLFVFTGMLSQLPAATGGKISGRVTDADNGEGLVAVNVILVNENLGAATDADGYYSILNVPPGSYELMVSSMGYSTTRMQNVKVNVDRSTVIDFSLDAAVLQGDEVVVVAEAPLVQADKTSSKSTVTEEELEIMPVENSVDILSTQAGVTTGSDGSLHVRGGRSSEVVYMIDGIPVSASLGQSVSTNIISEISLISGTFNAEYGKAMSGIVNITTKDADRDLAFNVKYQAGDMYSGRSGIYTDIDQFEPGTFSRTDLDISGPLPLLDNAGYFITGTFKSSDGWLYGVREHNTYDSFSLVGDNWDIMMTGDSQRVAMNNSSSSNLMGKLFFKPLPKVRVMLQTAYESGSWQNYDHVWKYNPDGRYQHENSSRFNALHLTHTLSEKSYQTLKFSYSQKNAADYVHKLDSYTWNEDLNGNGIIDIMGVNDDGTPFTEDLDGDGVLTPDLQIDWDFIAEHGAFIPNDTWYTIGDSIDVPHYVLNQQRSDVPAYHFIYGGQNMGYYMSEDITATLKYDITSQVTRHHQLRAGLEFNSYVYDRNNMAIEMSSRTNWQPYIDDASSASHDDYTKKPFDFSAYIQDKVELQDFVMNLGLRYDYFDANDYTFTDKLSPSDSDTLRASAKSQVSPRLGLSFPITDQGYIHFSYGHFFQMPGFSYLYRNPDLKKAAGVSQFGNPDLDAQKTVMYELGFQQQLNRQTAFDVTLFYRDIINWLSSEYNFIDNAFRYTKYVTEDYGNVRGITASLTQRSGQGITLNLDYTYQLAEGNASSPDAAYFDNLQIPPIESEKKVLPLSWDVRHAVNMNLSLALGRSAGLSVISSYASGSPYTPAIQGERNAEENSDNKPYSFTTDMQAYRDLKLLGNRLRFSLKVYNLLDRLNERYVHDDTGRAGYSLLPGYAGQSLAEHADNPAVHSLEEYIYPPTYYRNPRQILFSVSWQFREN